KGVKSVRGGAQGDLLCRVVVETPVGLNEKQKQLLKELQESFGGPTGENNSPRSKISQFDTRQQADTAQIKQLFAREEK
ncbi:hypothetical protein EXT84_23075, partial [Klebsiella quasipneumoniae subsp. similipneumoniae]